MVIEDDFAVADGAVETVEVSWIDAGGRGCRAGLGAVAEVAFENVTPARRFVMHRGQRHFPGMWWSATTGRHAGYESWLERDHAMVLDFDRDVVGFSSQPFTLSWRVSGKAVSHTPDYFARLAGGSAVVVDVRPADRVKPRDAVKFETTAAACAVVGDWSFRLVHELDPVLVVNVRWLSGYRHPRQIIHGWVRCCDGCSPTAARCWPGYRRPQIRSAGCRCCSTCSGVVTWSPI